jgi:hypothetical protein
LRLIGTGQENAPDNQHAVALAIGDEKHPTLLHALNALATEIAELKVHGLRIAGRVCKVKTWFCSDWKFLRTNNRLFDRVSLTEFGRRRRNVYRSRRCHVNVFLHLVPGHKARPRCSRRGAHNL